MYHLVSFSLILSLYRNWYMYIVNMKNSIMIVKLWMLSRFFLHYTETTD